MFKHRVNKLSWITAASLLVLTLSSTPARAHHEADILFPVVTAFALGALWYGDHDRHYYRHSYRYERHDHYRHGHFHRGHSYREQYSRGGYSQGYSPQRYYGQGSGHFGYDKGHGSNHGGHDGHRRKH
jgi:hypothetical protein